MGSVISQPSSVASASWGQSEPQRTYTYHIWHDGMWYGMVAAACGLLLFCALLAGLTLAVCGLDMTGLQMRGVTGTPKQQKRVLAVIKLKRHSTWMLCSLIMCSVAASESFPFFIQRLWQGEQPWVPILISTLSLGIFAEILPQYIIPRQAINWGYFCSPLIWSCMIVTSVVSYPLALLLDALTRKQKRGEIFSKSELAALIKCHEYCEDSGHGGTVGKDATRIMLGALQLDSRKVGYSDFNKFELRKTALCVAEKEIDLEKADVAATNGMVVPWSAVKSIHIDEPVNGAFIRKVKSWSYSRIPVIGDQDLGGTQIFGFLNMKNLLGLEISHEQDPGNCISVRDLPLYPLPIVQEKMSVYALLNIFQLGMSRMAVIIPSSLDDQAQVLKSSPAKRFVSFKSQTPCWTATQRTNARITSRLEAVGSDADWTADWATGFLEAAHVDINNPGHRKENVVGVRTPHPVGVITLDDIIDAILQKTSCDERDFFDRDNTAPVTSKPKAGHFLASPRHCGIQDKEKSRVLSSTENIGRLFPLRSGCGTMRKRKFCSTQKAMITMDGACDRSNRSSEDQSLDCLKEQIDHVVNLCARSNVTSLENDSLMGMGGAKKNDKNTGAMRSISYVLNRSDFEGSSYTENSQGGFHCANRTNYTSQVARQSEEGSQGIDDLPSSSSDAKVIATSKTSSLPSRSRSTLTGLGGMGAIRRSVTATPDLSQLPRITPNSRHNSLSFERLANESEEEVYTGLTGSVSAVGDLSCVTTIDRTYKPGAVILTDQQTSRNATKEPSQDDNRSEILIKAWNYRHLLNAHDGIRGLDELSIVKPLSSSVNIIQAAATSAQKGCEEDSHHRPYEGFPPELLGSIHMGKKRVIQNCFSNTLPRMASLIADIGECSDMEEDNTPAKAQFIQDDRFSLPSQRRFVNSSIITNSGGMRSSSFWI